MPINLNTLFNARRFYVPIITLIVAFVMPLVVPSPFFIHVLTLCSLFTIYASSWNLLAFSGQASLGHAAFLGVGGFTSSLLALNLGISPWLGLFIGGMVSAGLGFLVGLTCVRLREWYLAMVTFGFSVILETVISHFDDVFHGIYGFRTPILVPSGVHYYYVALIFAAGSVYLIHIIMKSKIGLALNAIHENESEARMIGINTIRYKLLAFVISTFFAGMAGALYAHFLRYINIHIFNPDNSFKPLMMAVIGGLGTIEGPIIGSIILVLIESFLPIIDPILQQLLDPSSAR